MCTYSLSSYTEQLLSTPGLLTFSLGNANQQIAADFTSACILESNAPFGPPSSPVTYSHTHTHTHARTHARTHTHDTVLRQGNPFQDRRRIGSSNSSRPISNLLVALSGTCTCMGVYPFTMFPKPGPTGRLIRQGQVGRHEKKDAKGDNKVQSRMWYLSSMCDLPLTCFPCFAVYDAFFLRVLLVDLIKGERCQRADTP